MTEITALTDEALQGLREDFDANPLNRLAMNGVTAVSYTHLTLPTTERV